jgi:hypothetical protein
MPQAVLKPLLLRTVNETGDFRRRYHVAKLLPLAVIPHNCDPHILQHSLPAIGLSKTDTSLYGKQTPCRITLIPFPCRYILVHRRFWTDVIEAVLGTIKALE